MTTSSPPVMTLELLQQFSDAWTAGDVDRLMEFMTDDRVYCASVGPEPGMTYRGRDEVRRGFGAMLAYDSGRERHGGIAFLHGAVGVAEWSFSEISQDGRTRLIRGYDIYQFSGDKIHKKDAFRKILDEEISRDDGDPFPGDRHSPSRHVEGRASLPGEARLRDRLR